MSINNKKTVVLSRFLCYLTIINDKLGDDERHYKCSKYNLPFATNFHGKILFLNDKIGKLPMLSALRFVKWHFLSFVFKFFVPNLFLSLNSSNKPYCISVCYMKSVVYQEEDNDIKFTGNYAIRGWLQHPPYRAYLVVSEYRL